MAPRTSAYPWRRFDFHAAEESQPKPRKARTSGASGPAKNYRCEPVRPPDILGHRIRQAIYGEGFGSKFRAWCDEAELPHCTAHGLRKAGAVIAAENGATPHQLMAIFGWRTLKEAERYTKAVQEKKVAASAMNLLVAGRSNTKVANH